MTISRQLLCFGFLAAFIPSTSTFATEASVQWDGTVRVPVIEGNLDYVVCLGSSQSLNVRDQSLSRVLFTVHGNTSVKIVQSFGTDQQEKVINGHTYTFTKVQFPERSADANIGWVAEDYLRLRSQCELTPPLDTHISSSDSSWTFPVLKRPSVSYKEGMRKFGASRDGGARLHAAADLYRTTGEPVVSVNAGTVIRDRYYFYLGTYAIEVHLSDGKVVRYGEITGKAAPNVKLGSTLKAGQTLGYVGKVNSGCCTPMLHFEMYKGTVTGPLTQAGNKFSRRKDLIDPTASLADWELAKFGTSY